MSAARSGWRSLALLLSIAVVVLEETLQCPPQDKCDYGNLPGLWREKGAPQWQLSGTCCQLTDIVGDALRVPSVFNATKDDSPAVRILVFGDSVERITLHDLCEQDQWDNWGHDQNLFHSCRRAKVLISRQSMIGVHPDGPYHMDMTGSPQQRIINGFQSHMKFTGHAPDAVVFSSFLWDLQRMGHYEPEKVAGKELSAETLSELPQYLQNVLRIIERNSPTAAVRVFKTTVPPLVKDCASSDGRFQVAEMGRKQHVLALNAVAMGVAAEQGWAIIDMAPITAYLPQSEYLRDLHHPSRNVSLAALNVLLNLVFSRLQGTSAELQGFMEEHLSMGSI